MKKIALFLIFLIPALSLLAQGVERERVVVEVATRTN